MRTGSIVLASALALGACTGAAKTPITDDFSDLAAADGDEKADSVASSMKVVGSLDLNSWSAPVAYTKSPKYRALKFAAVEGDHLDIWVHSDDGDAVAFLMDSSFKVLATNDDGGEDTFDSHIVFDLGKSRSATHYIAFREYAWAKSTFTVELNGGARIKMCHVDSDCVRVSTNCCGIGNQWDAVAKGNEAAYRSKLNCPVHQFCPALAVQDDHTMAECNVTTQLCEAVKPEDIQCGGRANRHLCPDGFECADTEASHVDGPGVCEALTVE